MGTKTLDDVKATLAEAKAEGDAGADISMARLFAKFGNATDEARQYAADYAGIECPAESRWPF